MCNHSGFWGPIKLIISIHWAEFWILNFENSARYSSGARGPAFVQLIWSNQSTNQNFEFWILKTAHSIQAGFEAQHSCNWYDQINPPSRILNVENSTRYSSRVQGPAFMQLSWSNQSTNQNFEFWKQHKWHWRPSIGAIELIKSIRAAAPPSFPNSPAA